MLSPKKFWSTVYAMQSFKSPRDYQSQLPSTDGETEAGVGWGGGGAKAWSRACSKLASWGMVLPQAS